MERRVEPELLDTLPAADLRAARSRRDLQRLNALMGHASIVARCLGAAQSRPPRRVVDLGGGDGSFLLTVAGKLARHWPGVRVTLVDRHNLLSEPTRAGFQQLGWQIELAQADAFEWMASSSLDSSECILANLFLHHFASDRLRQLLSRVAERTELFVACEPRRGRFVRAASRLLWMIGCNAVTRHDAVASVRAGFLAGELSSLWPGDGHWRLSEESAGPFSHCFRASRLPGQAQS